MNKRQARAAGLEFTGHYERWYDRDKLKTIAAVIRKLYKCKVVMVDEEGGTSLYADDKYRAINGIRDEKRLLDREETDIQYYRDQF